MTYTKEQLKALLDCKTRKCSECGPMLVDCINTQRTIKATLAADLLSANEEIERLRKALEPLAVCSDLVRMRSGQETCIENGREEKDWCNGCKARNALKGDNQ